MQALHGDHLHSALWMFQIFLVQHKTRERESPPKNKEKSLMDLYMRLVLEHFLPVVILVFSGWFITRHSKTWRKALLQINHSERESEGKSSVWYSFDIFMQVLNFVNICFLCMYVVAVLEPSFYSPKKEENPTAYTTPYCLYVCNPTFLIPPPTSPTLFVPFHVECA